MIDRQIIGWFPSRECSRAEQPSTRKTAGTFSQAFDSCPALCRHRNNTVRLRCGHAASVIASSTDAQRSTAQDRKLDLDSENRFSVSGADFALSRRYLRDTIVIRCLSDDEIDSE